MECIRFTMLGFALLLADAGLAQSAHGALRKGDRAYERDLYKNAEKHYRTAANHEVGNEKAVYNLGNALYQQGNWEDAMKRFAQAAEVAKSSSNKADALHNLGNALLKQREYKNAVKAYQKSLRLRPGDQETKVNLQMAMKKLKEEEQKKQEQEQQKQQQQNQNQQNQDPQQNQENQKQNQTPQNQQGQQPPPQEKEEPPIKKEEAKRLLETAIGPEDRKNAKKYRSAQQQTKSKPPKKDW